ncbi:MAG: hypothetical protein HY715_09560 [Planctomycetes bacterium]|nr:hypothetical protein [Planctomycetota bacterium]
MDHINWLAKRGKWPPGMGVLSAIIIWGLFALAVCSCTSNVLPEEAVDTNPGLLSNLAQYPHEASSYFKPHFPSNLCDSDPETFWAVPMYPIPVPGWIKRPSRWVMVDFGTDRGEVINTFQALPREGALANFWHKASLQGSNNGFFWTRLADVSVVEEPTSADWLTWHFDAKKRYRYYCLSVKRGFPEKYYVIVAEWRFGHSDLSKGAGITTGVQVPKDFTLWALMAVPGRITLGLSVLSLGAILTALVVTIARKGWPAGSGAIEWAISNSQRLWLALFLLFTAQFCILYHGLLSSKQVFTHDTIIWFGSFCYYLDSLVRGHLALWDPYMLAGTPFYPNIHIHGLLDPLIVLPLLMVKVMGTSILTAFTYFYLARLAIFTVGAYYLFKHITGCRMSALVSAGVLLFAVAPTSFRQMGILENVFLTPFVLYSILLFSENIKNSRRYLYLSCLVVLTGISLNVQLPAHFVFNLLMFVVVASVLKIINVGEVFGTLRDRKFLAFVFACTLIVLMMMAPSAVLYNDSHGAEGELFPSIRIIQKLGSFKKMVASEIEESVVSSAFTGQRGAYSSYGDFLGLVCPDLWEQYFVGGKRPCGMSEALMYIGIIPFILCVIGYKYSKSRYGNLASIMLILVFLNMFSYYGTGNRSPNLIQRGFNLVVPLLGTAEVRETFSGFFLLYLCIFLGLALKLFFNVEEFASFFREKYFQVINICAGIVLINIVLINAVVPNVSITELIWIVILIGIAVFAYLYSRRLVTRKVFNVFYAVVFLTVFVDMFNYNYHLRGYVLREDWLGPLLAERERRPYPDEDFEYFRIPFVGSEEGEHEPLAFSESIFMVKGALSRGNNHHFFSTKRYYDLWTNVPLQNQFALSGIVYPIVNFFPTNKVKTMPKRELLSYFETADTHTLGQYLFLEGKGTTQVPARGKSLDMKQLPDASCYGPFVTEAYSKYLECNNGRLRRIRKDLGSYLHTPSYQLEVRHFSPNELEIMVKNQEEGYLYYNDGWSKYWKAFDGGKEVPVEVANYNFKAVFLGRGEHLVRFVFDPWSYRYGVYAYYAGLFACLGMIVFIRLQYWESKSDSEK